MSIKDKLVAAAQPSPIAVEIEEWGGAEVHLLPFSGAEAQEHRELLEKDDLRVVSVAYAAVIERLVDEDGEPVFDGDDDEDYDDFMSLAEGGVIECYELLTSRHLRLQAKKEGAKGNLRGAKEKSQP